MMSHQTRCITMVAIALLAANVMPAEAQEGPAPGDSVPEWAGSFGAEGINTRFKLSGFADLDIIYDTDAIATPCDFVTSAIVTGDATKAEGSDGRTSFCVKSSRLGLETRTPVGAGDVVTYLSMDFFGDPTSTTPDPRLRQAYVEVVGFVLGGSLLAGQAWTTFGDIAAWPDILDFEGPNNTIELRQPLLRWTSRSANGLRFMIAAETPDNHEIRGADALSRWPDGVVAGTWTHAGGHLKAAAVIRDLRASQNDGPTRNATGWGLSGSGKVVIPLLAPEDNVTFQLNYGSGIGSFFADASPDAVYDPATNGLEAVPAFGAYGGLEHFWMPVLSSTGVLGYANFDNRDAQPGGALARSYYFSINVIWRPFAGYLTGVEFLHGERKDKDGARGIDNRIQLTNKFSF